MSTPEEEDQLKYLQAKNNELVQKVQYWKMTAAQKENEKLELMKEANELRMKLSRMKSGGAAEARKLDAALQTASEEALSHLVQASGAVARIIELAKTYMRDREELENEMPRWSNISGRSTSEKIHRVPPMMGGRTILPVVSLRRTVLNTSNPRVATRSPTGNTERTVLPMRMLQDVIIPLTRIDANDLPGNNETDDVDDSSEELDLDISNQSQDISEEDLEVSRRLHAVSEDFEPEDEETTPPTITTRRTVENPLEGPSWLLDVPTNTEANISGGRNTLEPDSTTEPEEARGSPPAPHEECGGGGGPAAFSPTVRRRKRASSPPPTPLLSPRHKHRRPSMSSRVLKVVLPKISLEGSSPRGGAGEGGGGEGEGEGEGSPGGAAPRASRESPARDKQMRFDAPSPNGATVAGVIVSEALEQVAFRNRTRRGGAGAPPRAGPGPAPAPPSPAHSSSRSGSANSRDSRDSSAEREGRTRRPRKPVTYKEKSLVCKLRR